MKYNKQEEIKQMIERIELKESINASKILIRCLELEIKVLKNDTKDTSKVESQLEEILEARKVIENILATNEINQADYFNASNKIATAFIEYFEEKK